MGAVVVPAGRYWGAQTQRALENFIIGTERMPLPLIRALGVQKKAAALANVELGMLDITRGRPSSPRRKRPWKARWTTISRSSSGRQGLAPRPT
jgi:hypothetical protein